MANMKVAIVEYEHTSITRGEHGGSIGHFIDARIADALQKHENVQEVSVYFEEQEWNAMIADQLQPGRTVKAK